MSIKVYDKSDSFDTQVRLSREFIDDHFGKQIIKLEKDGEIFNLYSPDDYGSVAVNDRYYRSVDEVLLEFGVIAQYQ